MIDVTKMRMGKCPYCDAVTATDGRGLYHEQPSCEQWIAEMAALPVHYAGPVNAIVMRDQKPGSGN